MGRRNKIDVIDYTTDPRRIDIYDLSNSTIIKLCSLIEVVNLIEETADKRQIPEDRRWRLYRASYIKKYMKNRYNTIENEIVRGVYDFNNDRKKAET